MTDGIRVTTHNFHYAAWYLRLVATAIDLAIVWLTVLLLIPGSFRVSNLLMGGHYGELVSFFGTFDGVWFWLLPLLYFLVFLLIFSRTPGMMLMKIKIANYDGGNISPLQAFLRLFAWIMVAIPLLAGLVPIFFTKKRQGLHDRLVKTIVIRKR